MADGAAAAALSRRLPRLLLLLSALPPLAWILLAQVGGWYPGELASHWTLQAAILLLPGWIAVRHDARWGRIFLLAVVIALLPWLRAAYLPRAQRIEAPQERLVSAVTANLNVWNPRRQALHDALRAGGCDFIGLAEVVPADRALWQGDPLYPNQIWLGGDDHPSELAFLSRLRIIDSRIHDLGGVHVIDALIDLGDGPLRIFMLHLSSPSSTREWHSRNAELAPLARLVQAVQEPLLVMGDFNISPGDAVWQALLKASELKPAPGHEPSTWPSWLGPCGIAIDHLLVRGAGLDGVLAVELPGSDHRGERGIVTVPMAR